MKSGRGDLVIGNKYSSLNYGDFTLVERNGGYSVIRFDTGYVSTVETECVINGTVKDPLYPKLFGIGFIGIGKHKARLGNAKDGFKVLPEYNAWINMLQRCYYAKYIIREQGCKAYDDVTVDSEWHNFQNFAEWYKPRREPFDIAGIKRPALDKDILATQGCSKVYSPSTCCLVPDEINGAFIYLNKEGILQGKKGFYVMHKSKRASDYIETLEEAREIRKIIKQEHFINLANKYKHVIEPKVHDKLCNWFD